MNCSRSSTVPGIQQANRYGCCPLVLVHRSQRGMYIQPARGVLTPRWAAGEVPATESGQSGEGTVRQMRVSHAAPAGSRFSLLRRYAAATAAINTTTATRWKTIRGLTSFKPPQIECKWRPHWKEEDPRGCGHSALRSLQLAPVKELQ